MFRRQLVLAILFLGLSNHALAQFMHRAPVRVVPVPSFNRTAPIGPHFVPMQQAPMHVVPNYQVQHFAPHPIAPHFGQHPAFPSAVVRPPFAPSFSPAPIVSQPASRRTLIGGLLPGPMVPARQVDPFYQPGVIRTPATYASAVEPSPQPKLATSEPSQRAQSFRPTSVDSKSNPQAILVDLETAPKPPKQLADLLDRDVIADRVATASDQVESNTTAESSTSDASDEDVWSMEDWKLDAPQNDQDTPTTVADVAIEDAEIPQDPAASTNDLTTEPSTEQQLATTVDEPADDWAQEEEDWSQEDWAQDWASDETSTNDDFAQEDWADEGQVDPSDVLKTDVATIEESATRNDSSAESNDVENLTASTIASPAKETAQDEDWAKEDWAEEDWAQEDWSEEGLAQEDGNASELAQELGLTNEATDVVDSSVVDSVVDSSSSVVGSPAIEEEWASTESHATDDWTKEGWVNEDWAKEELEKAKLAQDESSTSQQASVEVPEESDWAAGDDWAADDNEWADEDEDLNAALAEATQETDFTEPEVATPTKTVETEIVETNTVRTDQVAENVKATGDAIAAAETSEPAQAGGFDWRWLLALAPFLGIGAAWYLRKRRQAQAAAFLRPSSAAALPGPSAQAAASTVGGGKTAQIKTPQQTNAQPKPQPAPEPPVPADDLTRLRGVSAPISSLLNALGIQTYQKLAESNANDLRAVIAKGGLEGKVVDPAVWVYQAGFAVRKDWDGLTKWQSENQQLFRTAIQVDQQQAQAQTSDLTRIHGIDAPLAKHLAGKGLISFQQLATADPRDLRVLLSDAGPQYSNADTRSWPGLAALAVRGDWEKLQQLDSALEQGVLDEANSIFESLAASAKQQKGSSDTKTSPVG